MKSKSVSTPPAGDTPEWLKEASAELLSPADFAERDAKELSERYRIKIAEQIAAVISGRQKEPVRA